MAREVAILKRAKISEAQKYMIYAMLGAGLVLGVAIALVIKFVNQISANAEIIAGEDQSLVAYTKAIRSLGVCTKPKGEVYTDEEIKKCDPNSIEVSALEDDTLRYQILNQLAANKALGSVPNENTDTCINPDTEKSYTYDELMSFYNEATTDKTRTAASKLIQSCSALRVIPDTLPDYKNEEALLASLNKLFILSGWEPESISPSGESEESELSENLHAIPIMLSVEANIGVTKTFLDKIEHSIREFDIKTATFEWSSDGTLTFEANANAYYINKVKFAQSGATAEVTDEEGAEEE